MVGGEKHIIAFMGKFSLVLKAGEERVITRAVTSVIYSVSVTLIEFNHV